MKFYNSNPAFGEGGLKRGGEQWTRVNQPGEIPVGRAVIFRYRINGSKTNGINGQKFAYSDAVSALGCPSDRNIVEYAE